MKTLLIPVRRFRERGGRFRWPVGARLQSAREADAVPLEQLARELRTYASVKPRIVWSAASSGHAFQARRDPRISNPEGYRLDITPDGVIASAATDAGLYYAVQTLRDLIRCHGDVLPCGRIDDEPDVHRRGVYYDTARGKVASVETLQALIERLAHWKINEFCIYIKNTFTWKAHSEIGRGFSPYTPEEILAIQAHGRRHHVRFVPSLATFSHNELILQLPKYRCLAELPGAHGWEGGTLLCPTDPKSLRLVEDLYAEFVPLFEADDMHVGCDEPWELGQGRSKAAARRIGAGQVYLNMLLKVHRLCERHGKRMNFWGDIVLQYPELLSALPRDVVAHNWDYAAHGARMPRTREFAEAHVPVMVCPGTSGWQRHGTDLPNAMQNVANFARIGRRDGAEGLLHTDWGDFGHRNPLGVSLHSFAHAAAHAWHGRKVDDATFTERFAALTFGDDPRWPEAIRRLGETPALFAPNTTALYHALVEPVRPPADRFMRRFRKVSLVSHYPKGVKSLIDACDPDALRRTIEQWESPGLWPDPPDHLPDFEKAALADVRLAAAMDVLAAQRALLALRVRAGDSLPASEGRHWADAMSVLREGFEGLWRLRNKPGRLADNLKLMRWAEEEVREPISIP